MPALAIGAPVNPFATRYYAPGTMAFLFGKDETKASVAALYDTFLQNECRGQLVGPFGTGKSTLMRSLREEGLKRGHAVRRIQLREDDRKLPDDWCDMQDDARDSKDVKVRSVFLDGAEQLSRARFAWVRWRCRRMKLGLLITTHRSLGLPDLRVHAVDEAIAVAITERVLAACPDAPPLVAAAEAPAALAKTDGDMRQALFQLYDLYEKRWASQEAR